MTKIREKTVDGKVMIFRGKPLLRDGNQICYGDMRDEYMMFLMILSTRKVMVGGVMSEVPGKVIVQILKTDTSLPVYERLVRQFEKNNLHDAFNAGLIALDHLSKNG